MTATQFDIRTPDGVLDVHLFTPTGRGAGPWPAVLFYMDAFGIRPALAEMGQRLADEGFVVIQPNLYYRHGAFQPFDPRLVTTEGPERVRFKSMIASISDTMVMRDTAAVIDALDGRSEVRRGPMGAVGYCMGGGFALSAAGTFPDRVVAAASFHGGSLATAKPDSPHLLAPAMRARIYIGAAGIDPSFDDEQEQRLKKALDAAGVQYVFERYEGARHGFAVTGHLAYDRDASERHWRTLVPFLREALG